MKLARRLQRLHDRWTDEARHAREVAMSDRLAKLVEYACKHGLLTSLEREAISTVARAILMRHGATAARAYIAAATGQETSRSGPCA